MRRFLVFAISCALSLSAAVALAQPPTLASYWPNEDGRHWFYDQHYEEFFPQSTVVDDNARLFFAGTTTAAGGIDAQVLDGEVSASSARVRSLSTVVPQEIADPLLRNLWLARPDLRSGILQGSLPCPKNTTAGWYPLLLTGGLAYVQSSTEAAAWRCNLANTRAWLWLTSDFTPGSTATLQLVPDLADNVFLHLEVVDTRTVTVPAGTFGDCLHVAYVIDYGISECTDQSGDPIGTQEFKTTGFVRYAPGVGPIECFEEFAVEGTGTCPGPPAGTLISRATLAMNSPTVPALARSWGRVKADYHR